MKAIVCTKYGPPEVLQLREVEKPIPRDYEVLIKIHAISVTVGDSRIRGFRVPISFWLPARIALGIRRPKNPVLGSVFAGEIEAMGKDVKLFKVGDPVFAFTGHGGGAYAEYICMPENGGISIKPSNLSYEEAAAIPWGGITALYFLRRVNINNRCAQKLAGQKILIYGASGSIGTAAVQLAKYFGAEVTGVCSTSNLDLVRSLGAYTVIDYTKEDFTINSEAYDVIFETVGKTSVSQCLKSLKKKGIFLHAVATPGVSLWMFLNSIFSTKKLMGGTFAPKAADLIFLKELAEAGKIKPVIDRRYLFEHMVEAHKYVDLGHKKGDVIITV